MSLLLEAPPQEGNEQAVLADLAAAANREHAASSSAVYAGLEHAIKAGEALLAARSLVPRRTWESWGFFPRVSAQMRELPRVRIRYR